MDAKHTPGPWTFYTEPQPNGCPIVGAKGLMVAMLAHSIHEPEQHDTALANARLIAAAPMLLSSLRAAANYIDTLGGDSKSYRMLIAATINPEPTP